MNYQTGKAKMTNFRWTICAMLFFATTINYLDRQVLSLTFEDFIRPEFHWTDSDYGNITGIFSLFYAIAMLVAGNGDHRVEVFHGIGGIFFLGRSAPAKGSEQERKNQDQTKNSFFHNQKERGRLPM